MKKYSRPYCKDCKLAWGKKSIGFVLKCTKCGQPLRLKSFNPWPNFFAGIIAITLGALTIFIAEIPIIWIGGFIAGGFSIYNSFNRWSEIQDLDEK